MTARVSILMPARNSESFVSDAIDSILAQTFQDWELMVIDDASDDGTGSVAKGYDDPRIRVVRNEKPTGLAASLNRGIGETKAPFVARMDADDVCRPDRLSRQLAKMEGDQSIQICGSWVTCWQAGKRSYTLRYPTGSDCISSYILFGNPFAHPSIIFRRDLLDKGHRYDEDCSVAQDLEFWSRLLPSTKCENIPLPLLRYRVHGGGTTVARSETSDTVTRKVIGAQLEKLGYNLSDERLFFHRRVGHGAGARSVDELLRSEIWLKELLARNVDAKVLPVNGLRKAAGFVWARICANSAYLGLPAWRIYTRSALRMGSGVGEQVTFIMRMTLSAIKRENKPQGWLPSWSMSADGGND